MIWLPVVGFLAGFFVIWFKDVTIPSEFASYLSLATIAGIDTILGGIRSGLEGRFQSDIFLTGFLVNTIMAALLAYFGDQIGVQDLYLAAVVVLGWRIFLNLSLIRRYMLGRSHAKPHEGPTHGAAPQISLAAPAGPGSSEDAAQEPPAPSADIVDSLPDPSLPTPVEAP